MNPRTPAFPQLTPTAAHVWIFEHPEQAAVDLDVLSEAERSRARQYHFAKDANRFSACRWLLRTLLAQYLGRDAATLELTTGPNGKPQLREVGYQLSSDLHFNLTHTDGLALLAFTTSGPIGVDVEDVRSLQDRDELLQKYAGTEEQSFFHTVPPSQKDEAFFQWWTAREASAKQTAEGLRALEKPSNFARLLASPAQTHTFGDQALTLNAPATGYVAAVATCPSCHSLSWLLASTILQGCEVPALT